MKLNDRMYVFLWKISYVGLNLKKIWLGSYLTVYLNLWIYSELSKYLRIFNYSTQISFEVPIKNTDRLVSLCIHSKPIAMDVFLLCVNSPEHSYIRLFLFFCLDKELSRVHCTLLILYSIVSWPVRSHVIHWNV